MAVTIHMTMSREMFSCAFCTKIPGNTARNDVFAVSVLHKATAFYTFCTAIPYTVC